MSRQDWKAAKGKKKTFGLLVVWVVFLLVVVVVVPLEIFSSMVGLEGKNSCSWGSGASLGECCQAVPFHLLSLQPFRVSFCTCLSVILSCMCTHQFLMKVIAGGKVLDEKNMLCL